MSPRLWQAVHRLTSAVFVIAGIWYLTAWLTGGDMLLFQNRYTIPWIIPTFIVNRIAAHQVKQSRLA